jgi:hypothetical protein
MKDDPRSQARTERGDFLFAVKEYGDGTPFIAVEPRRLTTTLVGGDALLAFDLNPGVTMAQAQSIAEYLNKNISSVSFTVFGTHPMFEAVPPKG